MTPPCITRLPRALALAASQLASQSATHRVGGICGLRNAVCASLRGGHALSQIANAKGMERTAAANHAAAGTRLALSQAGATKPERGIARMRTFHLLPIPAHPKA